MGTKRMLGWAALALVCTTPAAGRAEPFVDTEAGLTSFGYAGRVRLSSPVALGPWRDGAPRLGGAAPADLPLARVLALVLVSTLLCAPRAVADPALPDTTLPLHLVGTVVAAQPERSIALIESAGTVSVLRAGDEVGGAQLQEIHKDGVVLALSGRLERLALSGPRAIAGTGSSSASASVWAPESDESADSSDASDSNRRRSQSPARAATASAVPASAAPADEDSESLRARPDTASPEALLASLSSQARYAPVQDASGALRGLALLDVRPDSALERIGLRSGDVVVSVAGVKLAQGSRALDALRGLDPRSGGEVLIERQGVPTRIAVPPGAL